MLNLTRRRGSTTPVPTEETPDERQREVK